MDILPLSFQIFAVGVLGLILGSFATALVSRIPQKEKIFDISQRSKCPHCGLPLKARDLVPVLSWLWLRGKCRYCQHPIGIQYPLIELLTAVLCVVLFLSHRSLDFGLLLIIASAPILMALLFIDLKHKILPNILVAILAVLGILRIFTLEYELESLLVQYLGGAAAFALISAFLAFIMTKALKKPALGMGDIKFFGVAGVWLGISNLAVFCVFSGVLGVILGLLWQKIKKEAIFPFGPALILAFITLLTLEGSHFSEKTLHLF